MSESEHIKGLRAAVDRAQQALASAIEQQQTVCEHPLRLLKITSGASSSHYGFKDEYDMVITCERCNKRFRETLTVYHDP